MYIFFVLHTCCYHIDMTLEDAQLFRNWNYSFDSFDFSSQRLAQPNIAYSALKKYIIIIYILGIKLLFVVIQSSISCGNILLVNTLNVAISAPEHTDIPHKSLFNSLIFLNYFLDMLSFCWIDSELPLNYI